MNVSLILRYIPVYCSKSLYNTWWTVCGHQLKYIDLYLEFRIFTKLNTTIKLLKKANKTSNELQFFYFSPHPYLFFNADRDSFTFLGFNIDRATGNVIDLQTRQVIITAVMSNNLFDALVHHRVPMNENFDNLTRFV